MIYQAFHILVYHVPHGWPTSLLCKWIELHDNDNNAQLYTAIFHFTPRYLCPDHYHAVLGHDHAYLMPPTLLRNRPSGYASGQGLGIHTEHIHHAHINYVLISRVLIYHHTVHS